MTTVGLVGREGERSQLDAAVAGASAGRGALVLVAGEAGVGKTVLVRSVLNESGLLVAESAAANAGARAYRPLLTALRSLARLAPPGAVSAQVESGLSAVAQASRLEPSALLDVMTSAFSAIGARCPAAVFLDDLQWVDEGTLELLADLAAILDTEPILIIGAYRSDEMPRGHPLRRLRSELRRGGRLQEVRVEPLSAEETAALVREMLGAKPSRSLLRLLFDRTGGVPFFVEELTALLVAGNRLSAGSGGLALRQGEDVPLPESVRDAVLLRAGGLEDGARTALGAAAALGQSFDPALASALAGTPGWPEETVRRGLVAEDSPGRLAFRHDLIREAFYGEIPWARRPALHRKIAELLQQEGAPASVVAEHWARGREPDRARKAFLVAADEFHALHAYRDAASALRRALDVWPEGTVEPARLDALGLLGQCAERAGDMPLALRAWREVVDGRSGRGEPGPLAEALRRYAGVLELQGRWEEAIPAREGAASSFASAGLPADAAAQRLAAAAHLRSAASFRGALALLETALADARMAGRRDLEARALGLEGNVRARMGERAGLELVRAGLTLALQNNLVGAAAELYQRLADSLEHLGEYRAARETYDEAFAYCSANALAPVAQLCLACLTVVLRQAGEWDRAAALCREVLDSPQSTPHALAVASGTLGLILALRGQRGAARPLLLESATVSRQIELAAMELLSGWGLAALEHEREPAAAAERCRAILERWRASEERHYAVSPLRWATTVFAEVGDADAVRACAAALTQIVTDTGQGEGLSALSHALGEVALLEGESDQAADQFARATALLAEVSAPLERIESQRRGAAALVACGRRGEAVELLVAAHRAARRLGARPLVASVADELAALGERAERRLGRLAAAQLDHGGLTARELEVIRYLAAGQTDREIARALFLSPRTVETHVHNIRMKLDCRSRAEAARRASELGLLEQPAGT